MKQVVSMLILMAVLIMPSCTKNDAPVPPATTGKNYPWIETLQLKKDTIVINGRFGPDPGITLRRVLINDKPVSSERIVRWDSAKIEAIVTDSSDKKEEKKVEVEVTGKKSNVKIIVVPQIPVEQLLRIDFLQVEEPRSWLYIYGNFGPDPGAGNREISIEQVTNRIETWVAESIILWSPSLIVVKIPATGTGYSGKVTVKTKTGEAHRYLMSYSGDIYYVRPQGGANGTLAENVRFKMRIRGDAEPAPEDLKIRNLKTNVDILSTAYWKGDGIGESSYNNEEGCGTIRVVWTSKGGSENVRSNDLYRDRNGWTTFVEHRRDGFNLTIRFNQEQVIDSKITYTDCKGNSNIQERKESIQFEVFETKVIPLRFDKGWIKAGEMEQKGLSSTAGLAWDAAEFPKHFMTATLKWAKMEGSLEQQ